MKISLNELKNTLEKLFEGFGCVDYQQSADMVYWSELLHLSGIERLASFLDKLEDHSFDKTPSMIYESESIALFDFLDNSCLLMGASIIDFSIVKALRRVEFIAHIQNCRNRSYLISKLIQFKSHNLNAVLKWVKNHYTNYAWIPMDSMYPRHVKIKNEIISNDDHTTCLLQVTQKNSTPIHMLMDIEKQSSAVEIVGKNIDLSDIMKKGLEVDTKSWNLILQYAKKILVSSNDTSLKQAGESFEKDPEDL